MTEVVIAPDHPIIFILDPSNPNITVPEYVDGELVAESDTCVSIGIRANVDGDTVVRFAHDIGWPEQENMTRVFDGRIHSPGKKLAISMATLETIASTDVETERPNFEVWVDDAEFPGRVVVCVEEIAG